MEIKYPQSYILCILSIQHSESYQNQYTRYFTEHSEDTYIPSLLISTFSVNSSIRIKSFKGIRFIDHDQFDLSQSAKHESAFSF